MAELQNGNVARLNEVERRMNSIEPMVFDLRADVRVIRKANEAIEDDIAEIRRMIADQAEGKLRTSASQRTAVILAVGAIVAALITAVAQLSGSV